MKSRCGDCYVCPAMCGRQRSSSHYLWILLLLLLTLLARGAESGRLHRLRRGQQTTAEQQVLDLARHWRRSVQQPQSPAPAQAVLIKPSPFDISSEAADVNEVETTSVSSSLPPRSPDTSTASEATKPTKKANHGGAATRLHVRRPLVNMTKDSGDSVRLKCEVAGGRPGARVVFRWYKNDAPVEEERNRLEIRQYPVAPSSSAPGQAASSADGGTSGGAGGSGSGQPANAPAYGSRLRIVSADVHDTGYYRCEAKSGAEVVETTGILRVSAGYPNNSRILPYSNRLWQP